MLIVVADNSFCVCIYICFVMNVIKLYRLSISLHFSFILFSPFISCVVCRNIYTHIASDFLLIFFFSSLFLSIFFFLLPPFFTVVLLSFSHSILTVATSLSFLPFFLSPLWTIQSISNIQLASKMSKEWNKNRSREKNELCEREEKEKKREIRRRSSNDHQAEARSKCGAKKKGKDNQELGCLLCVLFSCLLFLFISFFFFWKMEKNWWLQRFGPEL